MRGCRRRFATVQCSPTFKHDSMTALVVSHGMFTKKYMELDRLSNKQMDVSRFGLTFFWVSGRCLDICPHELPFLLVVSSFLLPKTGCMKITGFAPICGDWTLVSSNFPWKPILFLAVSKCEMGGLPTLPW